MRVLLTRPHAQSVAFEAQIKARFGDEADLLISPIVEIAALPVEVDFSAFDAFVFTSSNGVAAYRALKGPKGKTAYCVGDRTAAEARDAGLKAVSANGDVKALATLLGEVEDGVSMLHLCGKHVAGERLANVIRIEAYDQRPLPLSTEARDMLAQKGEVVVPLFSPKAAHWFNRSVDSEWRADLHAVCMSTTVAAELESSRFSSVLSDGPPTAEGMLDKMSNFFPARPA